MPKAAIRLLLTGLLCSAGLWPGAHVPAAEGSAGGSMDEMRTMMQRMMGDVLPPGIDPALLPQPDSAGARLLQHYCTQCHRLPGPGMHTTPEWPGVIVRMDQRMRMMQHMSMMAPVAVPSRDELDTITAYMQKFAQIPIDPAGTRTSIPQRAQPSAPRVRVATPCRTRPTISPANGPRSSRACKAT